MSTAYDTALATYMGTATGLTVYREGGAPQDSRSPYITYARIDQSPQYHMTGLSAVESAIYRVIIHTTVPAHMGTYETNLCNALHAYRGAMGDETAAGTFIERIASDILTPVSGAQPSVHTRELDVTVWFERTPIQR